MGRDVSACTNVTTFLPDPKCSDVKLFLDAERTENNGG